MLAVAAVATLAAATPAAARNGDLDPSFGTGGTVTADFGHEPGSDGGNNVVLLPKGRILTSGTGRGNGVGLAFYRRDGTLDPSFAGGGQVYYQLEPGGSSYAADVALAPDRTFLLGGFEDDSTTGFRAFAGRLTGTGEIDTTFGNDPPRPPGDGKTVLDFGTSDGQASAVAPAPHGGLYLAGTTGTFTATGTRDIFLARLQRDGSLAPSFGAGGMVIANPGTTDEGDDVAVQKDGRILVAGVTDGNLILLRYRPNGMPDTSFGGGDGAVTVRGLGIESEASANIGVLPDGRILVAVNDGESSFMSFTAQPAVARFTSRGKLDHSFHGGGTAEYPIGDSTYFGDMAVADDGRIVLTGYSRTASETNAVVQRLLPGGKLDRSFGTGGLVTYGNPGDFEAAFGVAVQRDRRIVVTGDSYDGVKDDRITFRLLGDTIPPDTAFARGQGGIVPPGKLAIRFHVRRDVHARFQCSLIVGAGVARHAAGTFRGCRSPLRLRARPNHTYLLRVRAIDRAGNVDPTPAKLRLRVR
jgi:uncharacterized delta-60 repeat protein